MTTVSLDLPPGKNTTIGQNPSGYFSSDTLRHARHITDPNLRVDIDGLEIRPVSTGRIEGPQRFILPPAVQTADIRILSRSSIVLDTRTNACPELRRVGVGLARITIEDVNGYRDIDLLDPRLHGLQAVQSAHGIAIRWTTGTALIPKAAHAAHGPAVLELHVLRTYAYWSAEGKRAA